jgi:hypothetical protein
MEPNALLVFGVGVVFSDAFGPHHAGDRGVLCQALPLDEKQQGLAAPATVGDLKAVCLATGLVVERPRAEVLEEAAVVNVVGQGLDRQAFLDLPDIGLAALELVERDDAGLGEDELLLGLGHRGTS